MKDTINIFYADDDEDDRDLFRDALSNSAMPLELRLFDNGTQLEKGLDGANYNCDLVFLDMNMPGKDGLAVLQSLQNAIKEKALRVVVFTTTDDPELVKKSYDLNAALFVQKPSNFQVLRTTLQTILCKKNYYTPPVKYEDFQFVQNCAR